MGYEKQEGSKHEERQESVSSRLLRKLFDLGVEYLFLNSGTDYAPIIETLSSATEESTSLPKPIVVPHEGPAVAMAMGYYLTSGNLPVVMVHTTPGTANSMANMLNAHSMNIPIMLMAGRTPVLEKTVPGSKELTVHWNQELRDQAEMLRQFTKWDWEHRFDAQLEDELVRGFEIAMNDPKGPVYMTWPRELLAENSKFPLTGRAPSPVTPIVPDDETLNSVAKVLIEAENPLVLTSFAGRNASAVKELVSLCETLSIPVSQNFYMMNFPTTHPMYIGKIGDRNSNEFLKSADLIFMVDVNVPWFPNMAEPSGTAKIIHLDYDPVKEKIPTWGFRSDIRLRGDSEYTLKVLRLKVEGLINGRPDVKEVITRRAMTVGERHKSLVEGAKNEAIAHKKDLPIDPRWLSYCLGTLIDDNSMIFGETVHSPFVEYIPFSRPGSLFTLPPFGALGWSMGAAIGAKLARPDSDVFAVMGDGSYMYNVPVSSHFVSRAMGLPIITIIYNNQEWLASKNAVKSMYPGGKAVETGSFPGTGLEPSPKFEKVAESSEALARRITDPDEIEDAIKETIDYTREKKNQALLNIILRKP